MNSSAEIRGLLLIQIFSGCRFSDGEVAATCCTRQVGRSIQESTKGCKPTGNVLGSQGYRCPTMPHTAEVMGGSSVRDVPRALFGSIRRTQIHP